MVEIYQSFNKYQINSFLAFLADFKNGILNLFVGSHLGGKKIRADILVAPLG